jgi:hypothetical protein
MLVSSEKRSGLLNNYFGGFDDGAHGVSYLQLHLIGAASRDDAFDFVIAYLHDNMSHDVAELDLGDFADQSVPG